MLQDQHLENNFDIDKLVAKTANFSGNLYVIYT